MGRPKGSKNKNNTNSTSASTTTVAKRGRPKGSKNKIQTALDAVQPLAVKEEAPTEQIAVLPAVREFILTNFGKMSNDELAMKCNLTIRQVEDIATDINQHFPDLSHEDKPQRLNSGHLKIAGTIQMTEVAGRKSDAFTQKANPKPHVEGLAPVRPEN